MLKLKFRDQTGEFFKLSVATVTLGRDIGNDVVVDDPSVSDFHAEITMDAQQLWIDDLLSANGTWVNDQRITQPCPLKAWDVIRLGNAELQVTDPNTPSPQDWALRAESDLLASQFHTLQKHTVVGRDPACDLSIDGSMLSRRHAELIIEEDHLQVIDLSSSNGTFLNGKRIEQGRAYPGDELRFDQQVFVVTGPRQPETPADTADLTLLRGAIAEASTSGFPDPPAEPAQAQPGGVDEEEGETQLVVPPPPRSFLTEIDPVGVPRRIDLDSPECKLGRSPECDFVLDDESVSKQHAEFSYSAGAWFIHDLCSSNGVLLNGQTVDQAQLTSGDRLQLGRLAYEFNTEPAQADESDPDTRIFDVPPAAVAGRARSAGSGGEFLPGGWLPWVAGITVLFFLGFAAFLVFS